MSSAINTSKRRKRAHDRVEYEYTPKTPGTMFFMDFSSNPGFGSTYFEPPTHPAQPAVGCLLDRIDDVRANEYTSWPLDSLQNYQTHYDSSFGNPDSFQRSEAPRPNYTFSSPNRSHVRDAWTSTSLLEREPRNSVNGFYRNLLPQAGQLALPQGSNISEWVIETSDTMLLPPEVTIDSPPSVVRNTGNFPAPISSSEAESRLNRGMMAGTSRRRQQFHHWGSHTSSSSENNFQTPPSSLSTSDGKPDFGLSGELPSLPERHQRYSISTTTSSGISGTGSGSSLQPIVYTPQSSSKEDWIGVSHPRSRVSALTQGLQESNDPGSQSTFDKTVAATPPPKTGNFRPRPHLLILPKIKDLTTSLTLQDGLVGSQKTSDRRVLTPKGRQEAKAVRNVGACLICRHLNKNKCSSVPGKPCESCAKLVQLREHLLESEELTTGVCIRIDLQSYRKTINDLYDVATRTYNIPLKPDTWKRTIFIGHHIYTGNKNCAYFPVTTTLCLDVQDCEFIGHGFGRKIKWKENSKRMSSYRVDEEMLPTAIGLDEWGRDLMKELSESDQIPDFEPSIRDKFLFDYCSVRPLLPFHNLASLTIRMISLSHWLHGTHPVVSIADLMNHSPLFDMSDISIDPMLSPVARGQLRSIAAKEMEETEKMILSFFDAAIKNPPKDVVIIGLCLWRLALLYRAMMKRYKIMFSDASIDRRREKQKVMYEAMTTSYSLVYRRSTSPYSSSWQMKDHLHSFGGNHDLVDTFLRLKAADRKFYRENVNDDDDLHARKLLWERMTKGKKSPK